MVKTSHQNQRLLLQSQDMEIGPTSMELQRLHIGLSKWTQIISGQYWDNHQERDFG